MRRNRVELYLSRTLRRESLLKQIELHPDKDLLDTWATTLGTKVSRRPRLVFIHSQDEIDRNLAIYLSEERTLPIEIDVLEQNVVTRGLANVLHAKAEAKRQDTRQWVGGLAKLGWAGGTLLGLAGLSSSNAFYGVCGGIGLIGGGLLEGYMQMYPYEPRSLEELPDLAPAVTVAQRT